MHLNKKVMITVAVAILACLTTVITLAATGNLNMFGRDTASTNPDDKIDFINIEQNSIGGYDYKWTVGDVAGNHAVGEIKVIGDYMYVFGMYYNGTESTLSTSTTSFWATQSVSVSELGWGCAAISRSKAAYNVPLEIIDDIPVTYYIRCWYNCKNMTQLPAVPATAKNTNYLCYGCTSLTHIVVNGCTVIGEGAFAECSSLSKIYLGPSVTTVCASSSAKAPFKNVKSGCILYDAHLNKPSGYETYWNTGISSVNFSANLADLDL